MPFLIAPLVAAALPAAASVPLIAGTSLSFAGILTSLLSTAATFGLQMALQPKQKGQTQQGQIAPKDSNPIRYRGYGRMRLTGPTFFLDAINGSYAHEGFVLCEGPI